MVFPSAQRPGVQRRAREEGAKRRPSRPSVCNGGLAGADAPVELALLFKGTWKCCRDSRSGEAEDNDSDGGAPSASPRLRTTKKRNPDDQADARARAKNHRSREHLSIGPLKEKTEED